MTFVDVDICHRMALLRTFFSVILTYVLKVKDSNLAILEILIMIIWQKMTEQTLLSPAQEVVYGLLIGVFTFDLDPFQRSKSRSCKF